MLARLRNKQRVFVKVHGHVWSTLKLDNLWLYKAHLANNVCMSIKRQPHYFCQYQYTIRNQCISVTCLKRSLDEIFLFPDMPNRWTVSELCSNLFCVISYERKSNEKRNKGGLERTGKGVIKWQQITNR